MHKKLSESVRVLELSALKANVKNPNRMSKTRYRKLFKNIQRTGRYEPVVVRPYPDQQGRYEILNGHHRVRVLQELGHAQVLCVVWDVDDGEAMVLLSTLNRLGGRDDVSAKSALVRALADKYDLKELAAMLPDTKQTLMRLKEIQMPRLKTTGVGRERVTKEDEFQAMTFFLRPDQRSVVDSAIDKAVEGMSGTRACKRAAGLVLLAETYKG